MDDIFSFMGKYNWLSNFHPAVVTLDGVTFPSVEHAYQAAKTSPAAREPFRVGSPSLAKHLGRRVKSLPENWEVDRLQIMEKLLRQKFRAGSRLAGKLLATGDALLVEGNYWNDTFWGVCRGKGQNHLGLLLMKIRDELREKEQA